MWRPQMLVFVKTHRNGLPKYPHFLSFVSQLKTFSVLCIFSNIITNKEMSQLILQYQRRHLGAAIDEESAIGDGDRIELEQTILTERKLLLQQEMRRHSIEGFVKVFTAPNSQIGQHILLHTMGLGELTPNTVIMEWPDSIPPSREIIDELQTVWQLTKRLGLSCLLCRGLSDFPDNHSVMIGK
jgi:hypothetical protein